jgi:hypothetical protein
MCIKTLSHADARASAEHVVTSALQMTLCAEDMRNRMAFTAASVTKKASPRPYALQRTQRFGRALADCPMRLVT